MYSCAPLQMDKQKQDDQLEPTYSSSMPIRDVALRTYRKQWTIGMDGERGSGISVLIAQHDDDDDIWILYRPVIKLDAQITTKIRLVFNCSLKNKESCSVNETAYPGINLLSYMLKLLLLFKTNKHVMLADTRKAFLMIRLNSEKDKNRFCFFL